jgi:hypothetical protein
MKKSTYELFTLNHDNDGYVGDAEKFLVVLHGFNVDAKGHKFTDYAPWDKSSDFTGIFMDRENPFVLIPLEYADLVGGISDTVAIVSPVYCDISQEDLPNLTKGLKTIKSVLTQFESMHMLSPFCGFNRFRPVPKKKKTKEELTKIAEVRSPRTSNDMFGYNLDEESDTYIKRTFKLTVNGDDSRVELGNKKLDKTVEEIHAQYLRPVSTSIGICYECSAIMLDRIGNINQIGRGYMSEERIKEHGYQHYTDVLNLYPSLWTYYTSTELKDVIRENAEKIYERPTEFEVIDREDELDAARMTIRNTIDYCLDVAPSVVEARRAFKDMVDDLDEETLTALAIGNYQDATTAVTKQFEEKENPLFDAKEFKDGLDRRFSMLRTKDYDPYYDE